MVAKSIFERQSNIMSNSSSSNPVTFSPTVQQQQPTNGFPISPAAQAQLQSMMPISSSLNEVTLPPALQQGEIPPTSPSISGITLSPAEQQLITSVLPTPITLYNITLPPAFQLPTDNSTWNSSSVDEVTLPPAIQGQINSVIPNFPITFDVAFNDSWYSVKVTLKPQDSICAAGYICNKTHQASCFDIQKVAITDFQFGDIHGGAYCPEDIPYYLNCPIGYYCPNPATKIICPAGKFCPHKTRVPSINCERCPAGATQLWRDNVGVAIIVIFFVAVIAYLIQVFFHRRIAALTHQLERVSNRILNQGDLERQVDEQRKRMERIRPKLEIIQRRLNNLSRIMESSADVDIVAVDSMTHNATDLSIDKHGVLIFHADELFDSIDTNGDGSLSYQELNKVLQLDSLELCDFMKRMNGLSSSSTTGASSVDRATFVQYFLEVLDETSNFKLSSEEAGSRWDEMFAAAGATSKGEVPYSVMYLSSMNEFLSDAQIKDVISGLRKAKLSASLKKSATHSEGITREVFCNHYPGILMKILTDQDNQKQETRKNGIDITFQNLKLVVGVGRSNCVHVVDDVSGRVRKGTMTALMGGSGAGKTSLLNALCGRAYYGEVQGDVFINGQKASVEDFADSIGFVPQDDIVFAELTVRENLIYSGRFRLPRGTSRSEIEDLADTVMADLGLSRKANSIVGDVTRRGVSGGEKKRVNIGLELMARPSALFLDEPTSGLDASSALLVMTSMKQLVENQGVTVCSVIHQPRKFIFDLFDSVLLLGVGGRMVYHGSVADSFEYFTSLGFKLPQGESLADWLIDISTGRVAVDTIPEVIQEDDGKLDEENQALIRQPIKSLSIRSHSMLREKSEAGNASSLKYQEPLRQDTQVISTTGHSGNKADRAENEAKVRRELLYENWKRHFSAMSKEQRKVYDPPEAYAFPEKTQMPSFLVQFLLQLRRMFLLAWRNRVTKIIETAVIVFAVAVVTFFDGTTSVSVESIPLVPFEAFIAGQEEVIESFFKPLFEFSLLAGTGYLRYGASVGVISGVLIALTAVKAITEKRLEFFREAGSGYDSNAYFLAVNVYTSVEQGVQIFFAAVIAQWTRQAIATKPIFYVAFLMLAWISVSWSLFIPLIVPPKNTLVLLGFFMAFFGLLFGGTSPPFRYEQIYSSTFKALFSAFLSPTRFFTETLAVSDLKCLPPQTGFTIGSNATSFPDDKSSFAFLSLGIHDSSVTDSDSNGWYWNVLPAFMIGLTVRFAGFGVINAFNRAEQAKKSFWFELRYKGSLMLYGSVLVFFLCLAGLCGICTWLIFRQT